MSELRDFEGNYHSPAWFDYATSILENHGGNNEQLIRAGGTDHVVFFVGDDLVLKIYRPERDCFEREKRSLEFASGRSDFTIPEIIWHGNLDGLDHLLMVRVHGDEMTRQEFLALERYKQVFILEDLACGLTDLHAPPHGFDSDWADFVDERAATFIQRQIAHGVNSKIISQLPQYIEESLPLIPRGPSVFMHADVHFGNLRFGHTTDRPYARALFDFADSRVGWHEYDLLAIGVLILQGEGELQREFFRAYGYADNEMDEEMRRRLMTLTMLYETADLRRYALRLGPDAVDLDLYELEKAIWAFV